LSSGRFVPSTSLPQLRWTRAVWLLVVSVSAGCGGGGLIPALPVAPGADQVDAESVDARIILIGDGGEVSDRRDQVLATLVTEVGFAPTKTAVVFLGDNVYDDGLTPPNGTPDQRELLRVQLAAAAGAAHVIMLPGNHDWYSGGAGLRAQEAFVESYGANATFLPDSAGCPGPDAVHVASTALLVILDTEWIIREGAGTDSINYRAACPGETTAGAMAELKRIVDGEQTRQVFVVAHHPLRTVGRHLCHQWYRKIIRCGPGDIPHERNVAMRSAIEGALSENPPFMYAAGHDHSLQLFKSDTPGKARYMMVSGSVTKATGVSTADGLVYAENASGFMTVDLLDGGRRQLLRVVQPGGTVRFSCWLDQGCRN